MCPIPAERPVCATANIDGTSSRHGTQSATMRRRAAELAGVPCKFLLPVTLPLRALILIPCAPYYALLCPLKQAFLLLYQSCSLHGSFCMLAKHTMVSHTSQTSLCASAHTGCALRPKVPAVSWGAASCTVPAERLSASITSVKRNGSGKYG